MRPDDVGSDWYQYKYAFVKCEKSCEGVDVNYLLNSGIALKKIIQAALVVPSISTLILFSLHLLPLLLINYYTHVGGFGVGLFSFILLMGFVQFETNTLRQSVAAAFIFASYIEAVFRRSVTKSLILFVAAFTFHKATIFVFPVLWALSRKRLRWVPVALILLAPLVIWVFGDALLFLLQDLLSQEIFRANFGSARARADGDLPYIREVPLGIGLGSIIALTMFLLIMKKPNIKLDFIQVAYPVLAFCGLAFEPALRFSKFFLPLWCFLTWSLATRYIRIQGLRQASPFVLVLFGALMALAAIPSYVQDGSQ